MSLKHFKEFDTYTEYEAYKQSDNYIIPNMSYCKDNANVYFIPHYLNSVYITYKIPELDNFSEKHWDSENQTWVIDKEYTEYEISLYHDENNYVKKVFINGIEYNSDTYHITTEDAGKIIKAEIILNSNDTVPAGLFNELFYIIKVKFGDGITTLEGDNNPTNNVYSMSGTFYGCTLEEIDLNNVTYIGDYCFSHSTHDFYYFLSETIPVVLPEINLSKVTYIGKCAFSFTLISGNNILPENVYVHPMAFTRTEFYNFSLTFPQSYDTIELYVNYNFAFNDRTYYINPIYHNVIYNIFKFNSPTTLNAFNGENSGLNIEYNNVPVEIPASVSNISQAKAFAHIKLLKFLNPVPPTVVQDGLANNYRDESGSMVWYEDYTAIYVPDESVEAYKSAWTTVANVIKPISEIS